MAAGRGKRVSKGKEICRISPFSALCFLFSSSSSTFSSKFPIFLCKNVFQVFPFLAFSKWTSVKVCPLLARLFPLPSKSSQLSRNFEWSSITKANFNKSETYVSVNGLSRLLDISPASGCFLSVSHFLENCQLLSQNHGIIELEEDVNLRSKLPLPLSPDENTLTSLPHFLQPQL